MATTECPLRAAAWAAHEQNNLNSAERLYRQLLQENEPADLRDAINLGALLRHQGRLKDALEHYDRWIPCFPDGLTLRLNGINAALDLRDLSRSKAWAEQGLQRCPDDANLQQLNAKTLAAAGQLDAAQACLEQLIAGLEPAQAGIWLDLGLIQHQRRALDDCLASFDRAAKLEPADPRSHANGITVLKELGRTAEALERYRRLPEALQQAPLLQGALAGVWMELQELEHAETIYRRLCEADPNDAGHWLNLAACLRGLIRINGCHGVLKQALMRHPEHQQLNLALAQCLAELGRQSAAVAVMRRLLAESEVLEDGLMINVQFHAAGYQLMSSEELCSLAQRWEAQKQSEGVGPLWADHIYPDACGRALRVGYFSADFANHPVGRFLLPVLRQHNRDNVHVVGLHHGPHNDAVTEQLKEACDSWVELRYRSDLWAARMIADLHLDVLVELGGYTGHSRPGVMVHRPAPVQLSYLGYYAPTYLSCIDGWIGDEALFGGLNSTDREAHQLLKVPTGYMSFVPEHLPPLTERCPAERFRFGSFNHSRKLTPGCVDLFCAVLKANPHSDLVLKSMSFSEESEQQRIRDLFRAAGLEDERLILLPWVEGWSKHMVLYAEMDVALDPIPYGGATTTCEALLMGVPVVTLAGDGMVGRLSASVLTSAGQTDWIASNETDYIAIAQRASKQGLRGRQQREQLRETTQASNLGDPKQLARQLEQVYRDLVRSRNS